MESLIAPLLPLYRREHSAGRAVALDPLDDSAQELFLRTLVAAGHPARAAVHLSSCEAMFAREGLTCSPALRSAARPAAAAPGGLRDSVVAKSLLRAGRAALDAGSADAGVETLRRAAEEAEHVRDPLVLADVLAALGSALVHAVRGFDGEGAVVLNRALAAARSAGGGRLLPRSCESSRSWMCKPGGMYPRPGRCARPGRRLSPSAIRRSPPGYWRFAA